jgi:cytochrome c-type biogenesis protein
MSSSIFFGGSVLAAVIAGAIALFAPCCVSVMLPAYFASSFPNRRLLVAMTFLFAAGIATVILPIAMGASLLQRLLTSQHTAIYVTGGLIMLALALYVLLGGQMHLPMPGRRVGGKTGVLSVYTLGIFSGMASSCCAPVLAGVIALSSVASSFWLALSLGTAYVFGMVAPLFVIALLWERFGDRVSRLFRPRAFMWRLGSLRGTLTATNLASGLLLAFIGGSMLWVGLSYSSMPPLADWQERFAVGLQHIGQVITNALTWLPNWAGALIVLALIGGLAWYALRQVGARRGENDGSEGIESLRATETLLVQTQEEPVEHQDSTQTAGEEKRSRASTEERSTSKEGSLFP